MPSFLKRRLIVKDDDTEERDTLRKLSSRGILPLLRRLLSLEVAALK